MSEYTVECQVMESSITDNAGSSHTGNCNVDLNECASSPCQNGATCTESIMDAAVAQHDYTCTCLAGFSHTDIGNWADEYGFVGSDCDCAATCAGTEHAIFNLLLLVTTAGLTFLTLVWFFAHKFVLLPRLVVLWQHIGKLPLAQPAESFVYFALVLPSTIPCKFTSQFWSRCFVHLIMSC